MYKRLSQLMTKMLTIENTQITMTSLQKGPILHIQLTSLDIIGPKMKFWISNAIIAAVKLAFLSIERPAIINIISKTSSALSLPFHYLDVRMIANLSDCMSSAW